MGRVRRPTKRYPSLRAWREDKELNQREAGRVLGISQTTYARLERGDRVAVRGRARRIMATTGVPLEVLVGLAEPSLKSDGLRASDEAGPAKGLTKNLGSDNVCPDNRADSDSKSWSDLPRQDAQYTPLDIPRPLQSADPRVEPGDGFGDGLKQVSHADVSRLSDEIASRVLLALRKAAV